MKTLRAELRSCLANLSKYPTDDYLIDRILKLVEGRLPKEKDMVSNKLKCNCDGDGYCNCDFSNHDGYNDALDDMKKGLGI